MDLLATIVDTKALAQSVGAALVAGVGVTLVFAIALFGATRAADSGRDGRAGTAAAYLVLAAVGALAFTAMIVIGIIVMTQKS